MKSPLTPPPNAPRPPVCPVNLDEIIIDLSTSCSREDGAAKLLGWLRGPILYKYIEVTSAGITVDQLKHISSLECTIGGTLTSQLTELRQTALIEFYNVKNGADLEEKANAVLYWDKQIHQAARYLRDIDDELGNSNQSMLRLDKSKTDESGITYITLSSLNKWARDKYNISIFNDDISDVEENVADDVLKEIHNNESVDHQAGMSYTESKKDGELNIDPNGPDEVKNAILINNIYITLGFFLEAFSQTVPKYRKETEPNCDAISDHLERAAIAANHMYFLYGHRSENLRKLFRKALNSKSKLGLRNTYPNGESIVNIEKEKIDEFLKAEELRKKK